MDPEIAPLLFSHPERKTMISLLDLSKRPVLMAFLALLAETAPLHAQVSETVEWGTTPTQTTARHYINFGWATNGVGIPFQTQPSVPYLNGLKGVALRTFAYVDAYPTCYEVSTSIATTGYPYTRIWFYNRTMGNWSWQSISSGATNFVRIFADLVNARNSAVAVYSSSTAYNSKDFYLTVAKVASSGTYTASQCKVPGKPFIDFTKPTDGLGGIYTSDTN
jgi:hypothetical protein